jgi:hypothetical protein
VVYTHKYAAPWVVVRRTEPGKGGSASGDVRSDQRFRELT